MNEINANVNDIDDVSVSIDGAAFLGKGDKGDPGTNGTDGVSPGVTISQITGGHTVTITDKDHPNGQSFNVMDGEPGEPGTGDFDELSNRPSYNGNVMTHSTNIPQVKTAAWDAKYDKPAGGIPDSDLASVFLKTHQSLVGYATEAWVEAKGYITSLAGYATQAWVEAKGYLTEHQSLADYATKAWVEAKGYITSLSGYATEAWVEAKGYLTSHQSLAGYATEAWVTAKNYLTEHQSLAAYSTTAQMNTAIAAHHDSSKQDTIADLAAIRSGAAAGATAVQTETDPVFAASAAHGISAGDISNWNGKGTYSKPSGGIPKTDLAAAVQTSLDKADSALQSHQDISGKQNATDNNLTTTAKTVVGAINEHESDISQLSSDKVDKASQASKTSAMTQAVGIDANGKLWSVPGGGGGSAEQFELIDTITTTEALENLRVTQEPDGTPYAFKRLLIRIAAPASGVDSTYGRMYMHTSGAIYGRVTGSDRYIDHISTNIFKKSSSQNSTWVLVSGVDNLSGVYSSYQGQDSFMFSSWSFAITDHITGFNIEIYYSSIIPSGTTISIYGVRA